MTTPGQPDSSRRRRAPALAAAGVVLIVSAAAAWYFWPRADVGPPTVDLAGADPDVARAVEEARAAVKEAPQSAEAWGRLGMVLRAHNFGDEANVCFERAEHLDAADPRWPYLRGVTVALTDRDAAIPLLERA